MNAQSKSNQIKPSLGAAISKEVKTNEIPKEIQAAIKLLEESGYKVTKKGGNGGQNPRIKIKIGKTEYSKLTDALRAHEFNVQGDWIAVRKGLKDNDGKFEYNKVMFEEVK